MTPELPPPTDPRFRLAFLNAPIGMVLVGAKGRISLANDAFARMLSYAPEDLVGRTYLDVTHADDRASSLSAVERAREGDGHLVVPRKRYVAQDGSTVWGRVHVTLLDGQAWEEAFAIAQVEDITKEVQTEWALQRSHDRLEHAQRIAQLGSWEVELATGDVIWSNELYRIYGLSKDLFVPGYETFLERVHPDDRDEVEAVIERIRDGVVDEARPLVLLHRIVRPDGSVRSLATEGRLEYDAEGRPARMVGTSQDVTAREVARGELEKRVRQQDALADLAGLALESHQIGELLQYAVERATSTLDADYGHVIEVLPGGKSGLLQARTGWGEDAGEREVLDLEEGSQARHTLEMRAPVRVDSWAGETRLTAPPVPPELAVASSVSVPVPGPEDPFGVLCVHSRRRRIFGDDDVRFLQSVAVILATAIERKEAEHELRRRDEQLVAAQRLEAIARLVGGVSHDFNNLLLVITGFAGLLEGRISEDDDRQREVKAILQAAQRATALTGKLLAFSRKQMMQARVVDLNRIIMDVRTMLERALREDIELDVDLEDDVGNVRADPVQVEQVLLNLAVNARDAMPDGGRIRVRTRGVLVNDEVAGTFDGLQPGRHVRLSLEDTGCGMDEDTLGQVFEPFFTTKSRDEGTGLGLATVYGIVKQTGGDVTVRSELGRGTRVDILLPIVDEPADRVGAQSVAEPVEGGAETVLVVEDEDAVRDLAARFLREYGYDVIEAPSALEALDVANDAARCVDLLLTDVVMPRMGGPELAIRARGSRPGLKVLFMSGYAERPKLVDETIGADAAFLRKPFRAQELAQQVRMLLDAE